MAARFSSISKFNTSTTVKMIRPLFVIVALLSHSCFAVSSAQSRIVLESVNAAPSGFVHHGAAAANTILELHVSLKQGNMPGLEQELYAVSTPGSERYGKHLSKSQVEEFVKPSAETLSLVNEWLAINDISSEPASPAGDYLKISIPVSKANVLLDANFSLFMDEETSQERIRTLSYSIPANLQGHINLVHPTVSFTKAPSRGGFKVPKIRRAVPSSCTSLITPSCLQAFYNIPTTLATQTTKNTITVSGFNDEFAQTAFLEQFLTQFRPDLSPSTTFATQFVDGGQDPQSPFFASDEADLDIQYTVGVASGVPATFLSVGTTNTDGISGFLDEANFVLAEESLPTVLTTSYGFNENAVSAPIAIQLCNAYMQLGARGTSLFFSSGDGAVGGIQLPASCGTSSTSQFVPTFPSTCPFVTSVGGTTGFPETAADFSTGGFSNIFASPSYQSVAVSSYLTRQGTTNAGKFNVSGRAFPDLSAQSTNFEIVETTPLHIGAHSNAVIEVSGTSCAAPTVASIVALLNDRLIAAGKSPLGFLNPLIYSAAAAAAFNDITKGTNPGCGSNGFPAMTGWDPISGVGTPDFAKLLTVVGL